MYPRKSIFNLLFIGLLFILYSFITVFNPSIGINTTSSAYIPEYRHKIEDEVQLKTDQVQAENSTKLVNNNSNVEVHRATNYLSREPFQSNQIYNISIPHSSFDSGQIYMDNFVGEMIENGSAEKNNLTNWSQYNNKTDINAIQRLNSTNKIGYQIPNSGNDYFYLINATSMSSKWEIEYAINQNVPSKSPIISFQFANRYASWASQQSIQYINLNFEFDSFTIVYNLYSKQWYTSYFNQTKNTIHFNLNKSWGDQWYMVTTNVTSALLEQGIYNHTTILEFFNLNRILIECWGDSSYQFHLLLDNISLKSSVLPPPEFIINGKLFQTNRNESIVYIDGIVGAKLHVQPILTNNKSRYYTVTGDLIFDLWFQESFDTEREFSYINTTYISWEIGFDLTYNKNDSYPKALSIIIPSTWTLTHFYNPHHTDLLSVYQIKLLKEDPSQFVIEVYDELVQDK